MEKYLFHLLRAFRKEQMSEKDLEETLLQLCIRERSELSDQEATERGYDIYKWDSTYQSLLTFSLNEGYLAVVSFGCLDRTFIKLDKGEIFLQSQLTDHFSSDYLEYEAELNRMMDIYHQPRLERIEIMKAFWSKLTIQDTLSCYLKQSSFSKDSLAYHQHILELTGIQKPAQELIHINLVPKLFVPDKYIECEVTLQVKGIEIPNQLVISQPYQNKRYFVAGLELGRNRTASGFYPLITECKDDLPESLSLEYHWTIHGKMKDEITIIHRLHLNFDLTPAPGLFFSSVQKTSRSMMMNQFDLVTYMGLSSMNWKERKVKYKTNYLDHFEIDEAATLTNFPVDLHSTFYGDCYFNTWYEKMNTSDKVM